MYLCTADGHRNNHNLHRMVPKPTSAVEFWKILSTQVRSVCGKKKQKKLKLLKVVVAVTVRSSSSCI